MKRWTIWEAAAAIRSRCLTPLELTELCLDRIDQLDDKVQAWACVDRERALEVARQRTWQARQGQFLGPLHGIPLGIKDIFDVAGLPTTAGSKWLNVIPERDATLVARLRQQGAVILGKTVTTESAGFDPPPTRNPWNLDHTPGGSSSGSAAGVALGMCVAAIGSQTGGSITRPASFCGVAGCKPELGRISVDGTLPISFHLDHPGPIATCAYDLAVLVAAMEGADPRDPLSDDFPPVEPGLDFAAAADRPPILVVLEGFFLEQASPGVRQLFEAAVHRLQEGGAQIRRMTLPPSFADLLQHHRRIMAVEAAMVHRLTYAEHAAKYGPKFKELIEEGLAADARDYAAALSHRRVFQHEICTRFAGADALLTPATVTTAPGPETTGDASFNSPWSYSGLPTVSLPCGLDDEHLPAALQMAGAPGELSLLLGVAAWCEEQLHFHEVPPLLATV